MQPQHLRPHPRVTPDQSRDPEHEPHRGNAAVLTPQQHFKLLTRKEATINNNKFSSGSATSLHTKAWLAPRNFLVLPEFKPPTYRTKRPSWGGGGGGGRLYPWDPNNSVTKHLVTCPCGRRRSPRPPALGEELKAIRQLMMAEGEKNQPSPGRSPQVVIQWLAKCSVLETNTHK